MSTTYVKTINLAPSVKSRRHVEDVDGMPSAMATLAVILFIWMVATLLGPEETAVAHAQAFTDTTRPAVTRTEIADPITVALLRADGWVPWHELCTNLVVELGDTGILEELKYSHASGTLQIRGRAHSVNQIPELMLLLEQHTWLQDLQSIRAVLDSDTGLSLFTLQGHVEPPLKLKPVAPGSTP